ncbi:MAG: EamA family transporter [Nitrospirota bacterium]
MASLYILIAIFIWSSLGIVVRAADTGLIYTIFFPAFIALVIQSVILFLTKEHKELSKAKKIPYLFLLGPVFLFNNLLFYFSFKNTTIANAVMTHYTAPVFVSILSPLLLKEPVQRIAVMAIIISSAGLWLMLNGFSLSEGHLAGIIAGVLSGITYALIIIIGRFLARNFSPLIITVLQNLMVVSLLLPFIKEFPAEALGYFVVLGLVHSTIAPLLYIRGLKEVMAGKAAILGYLEPVGAMMLAMFFFGEFPGIRSLLGGFLILFSGYLIIKKRNSDIMKETNS